jgi:hypothetical protein
MNPEDTEVLDNPLLDEKKYSLENGNRPLAYTLGGGGEEEEEEEEEEEDDEEEELNKKLKIILSHPSVFKLVRQ